ncbi:sensor histidine kinase [Herbiconiux sp. L3-i23]|uniref:sensor histidine kinase n=1 Tax=Herbiconiux sp. L3-i23 TaxID=2905871 RepID=UPI0020542C9A|nr:sensor histidine kinase [Herbiconiux sp. L3-i23]BDI23411.1 two-component sensor histidine kinase [Herbiconiux sp. L3-i23]
MTSTLPRPAERGAFRTDAALAAGFFVAYMLSCALYSMTGILGDLAPGWTWPVLGAATTLPLAWRRRYPNGVALVVAAGFIVGQLIVVPDLIINNIALFLAIYTVGAWTADRRRANLSRTLIVTAMAAWLFIAMFISATDPDSLEEFGFGGALTPLVAYSLINILINVLYFAAAWMFGERSWNAALASELLRARTRELEEERELTAAQAVALDRVRIARELHDVVAHHVSVMGVQAGAARVVLDSDPVAARRALESVEESARTAIQELRGLLTTLRSHDLDDDVDTSSASLDRLPELAELSSASGMPTSVNVIGEPRPLPAVTSVNLYRIAQEALTNARRHGPVGTEADVRLRYEDDGVELEITNSGARSLRAFRPGLGQLGMRERATASGGSIEIGPRDRGGWLVRVRVPDLRTAAAQPVPVR